MEPRPLSLSERRICALAEQADFYAGREISGGPIVLSVLQAEDTTVVPLDPDDIRPSKIRALIHEGLIVEGEQPQHNDGRPAEGYTRLRLTALGEQCLALSRSEQPIIESIGGSDAKG